MTDHKLIVKKRMEEQFKIYERLKKLKKNVKENNEGNVTARMSMIENLQKQYLENSTTITKITEEKNIDISEEHYITQDLGFHFDLLYAELKDAKLLPDHPEENLRLKEATKEDNTPAEEYPKSSVKKFSGVALDWIKFREEFDQSVISKSDLTDSQKFEHLQSALPKETVFTSDTGVDFTQALKILDEKYQSENLIDNLKKIIQHLAVTSFEEISEFLDGTMKNLSIPKSLNANVYNCDDLWISVLVKKFNDTTKYEWFKKISCNKSPKLYDFFKFLISKYSINGLTDEIEKFNNYASSSKRRSRSRSSKSSYSRCVFCQGIHKLWQCEKFERMGDNDKWDFVYEKKVCRICLNLNHSFRECRSEYACRHCGKKSHHYLLHRFSRK